MWTLWKHLKDHLWLSETISNTNYDPDCYTLLQDYMIRWLWTLCEQPKDCLKVLGSRAIHNKYPILLQLNHKIIQFVESLDQKREKEKEKVLKLISNTKEIELTIKLILDDIIEGFQQKENKMVVCTVSKQKPWCWKRLNQWKRDKNYQTKNL